VFHGKDSLLLLLTADMWARPRPVMHASDLAATTSMDVRGSHRVSWAVQTCQSKECTAPLLFLLRDKMVHSFVLENML
jgi:hypothetical protein